jgi:hypothetical protein
VRWAMQVQTWLAHATCNAAMCAACTKVCLHDHMDTCTCVFFLGAYLIYCMLGRSIPFYRFRCFAHIQLTFKWMFKQILAAISLPQPQIFSFTFFSPFVAFPSCHVPILALACLFIAYITSRMYYSLFRTQQMGSTVCFVPDSAVAAVK